MSETSAPEGSDFLRLGDELRRAAERVEELGRFAASPVRKDGLADAASAAGWLYRTRRMRDELFPAGLFAEPSWDILLDLYVAAAASRELSVSAACQASASPATTALRHLGNLEAEGLVRRRRDPGDPRRHFVELTADGVERMERFLAAALSPGSGG